MATISEALAQAVQNHQAGRLQAAEQVYRQILAVEPNQADALHLLGVLALQVGRPEIAVEHISRAIASKGTEALFHNNLGEAYRALMRWPDAASCYRRAAELNPHIAEVYNNLGAVLKNQGTLPEAVACYRRALELKPDLAEVHSNLGAALQAQGKLDEAIACFRQALHLKPDQAQANSNLGSALKSQGKLEEAVACYRRALALKPDLAEAHNNLGNAYYALGQPDEAVACYGRALKLNPHIAETHDNMGDALQEQGELDGAIACYRRALELSPRNAEAHFNLGRALKTQGKLDEAVVCYHCALELKPDFADAHCNLGGVLKDLGKLEDAIGCYRRALQVKPDYAEAHSDLICTLNYHGGQDSRAIYLESLSWSQQHAEALARTNQPHANERSASRRLRLGYVSADFRDHVVGRNLLPLFREHDHRQFEIVCYAHVLARDVLTERIQSCADAWRTVDRLTDEALAQRIREDRIDILVDLAVHTAHNRLLVFAHKPAPVQVTFAGYPGTTGLSTMNYRLTDVYLDPPGLYDRYYSEESIRLPNTFWCYDPLAPEPAVNSLPALAKGYVTFGCLNNFCKTSAAVLGRWAQLLRAVDRSRIMIAAPEGKCRHETLALLAREGIAPERVLFVAFRPRQEYLALYHGIDVGLDTLPYNGHTTSLDSFWMGVPVVTLVGQTVVGRAGLSQLSNLGLPELIAETPEQFVNIAAHLAGDLPRLSQLRATMRERMQSSPLMDAPRFARNIEAAYRGMWQRWCAK